MVRHDRRFSQRRHAPPGLPSRDIARGHAGAVCAPRTVNVRPRHRRIHLLRPKVGRRQCYVRL